MVRPLVTIAIPCLNEERFIEAVVNCALRQDYPTEQIEIIVADGGSTDRTRQILEQLTRRHPRLRWIDNPERIQAAAMNAIIKEARGEIIVRFDAHGEYARTYVHHCVDVLEKTGSVNVGGAQRALAKNLFQRALCAALDSPLGVGGAKYRSEQAEGFVDTVWLGAFHRSVFESVGLFDAGAVTNEDAELNQRILESGGKVYLSQQIEAYYYPRGDFRSLAKQYFRYGVGRARTLLKHGGLPKVRPLIPFAFVTSGALLLMIPPLYPLALCVAAGYTALCGVEAVRVGYRGGLPVMPLVWGIFPVLHVSHGVGFATGLLRYLKTPDWSAVERLSPDTADTA